MPTSIIISLRRIMSRVVLIYTLTAYVLVQHPIPDFQEGLPLDLDLTATRALMTSGTDIGLRRLVHSQSLS